MERAHRPAPSIKTLDELHAATANDPNAALLGKRKEDKDGKVWIKLTVDSKTPSLRGVLDRITGTRAKQKELGRNAVTTILRESHLQMAKEAPQFHDEIMAHWADKLLTSIHERGYKHAYRAGVVHGYTAASVEIKKKYVNNVDWFGQGPGLTNGGEPGAVGAKISEEEWNSETSESGDLDDQARRLQEAPPRRPVDEKLHPDNAIAELDEHLTNMARQQNEPGPADRSDLTDLADSAKVRSNLCADAPAKRSFAEDEDSEPTSDEWLESLAASTPDAQDAFEESSETESSSDGPLWESIQANLPDAHTNSLSDVITPETEASKARDAGSSPGVSPPRPRTGPPTGGAERVLVPVDDDADLVSIPKDASENAGVGEVKAKSQQAGGSLPYAGRANAQPVTKIADLKRLGQAASALKGEIWGTEEGKLYVSRKKPTDSDSKMLKRADQRRCAQQVIREVLEEPDNRKESKVTKDDELSVPDAMNLTATLRDGISPKIISPSDVIRSEKNKHFINRVKTVFSSIRQIAAFPNFSRNKEQLRAMNAMFDDEALDAQYRQYPPSS